jgi:hypothetical protein
MADGSALAVLPGDREQMASERAIKSNAGYGAFRDIVAICRQKGMELSVTRMTPGENRGSNSSVYVI